MRGSCNLRVRLAKKFGGVGGGEVYHSFSRTILTRSFNSSCFSRVPREPVGDLSNRRSTRPSKPVGPSRGMRSESNLRTSTKSQKSQEEPYFFSEKSRRLRILTFFERFEPLR